MEKLRALITGAGSAGVRHIENLLLLGVEVSAYRNRSELSSELSENYKIKVFKSLEEALEYGHDAVVIANRTDQHISTALLAAEKGLHLYIEKPLSHKLTGVQELQEIVKSKNLIVEIGCMMRFHPNLKLIHRLIEDDAIGVPYFARACVGQYLPDWRPGQDYRQSYSARAGYGGGVLLDLIHELDYLYWMFGRVKEVSAFIDHVSNLEIETEDIAQVLLRFDSGVVAQVEMDYLSPFYRRGCEVVGNRGIVFWDYNKGEVVLKALGESEPKVFTLPSGFERNTMFIEHMRYFLKRIQNGGDPAVSFEDGINVLKVALAARESSEKGIAAVL